MSDISVSEITTGQIIVIEVVQQGPRGLPGSADVNIVEDVTLRVDQTGLVGHFDEPGQVSEWLAERRIMPGVTVTVDVADGTYECTKPILGHVDGQRIRWQNDGLNGDPLVGADFADLDANWTFDPTTGLSTDEGRATNKPLVEAIVRAKYKVILEFDGEGDSNIAMRCDGHHAGDWGECPCLFINTGDAAVGVITGTGEASSIGDGPGGVAAVAGSAFFGFGNANLVIDYGGIINVEGVLSLFADHVGMRADFTGGFYGQNAIIQGCKDYGYRSNHGGFFYGQYVYIRGCNIGAESTNSPSMYWFHDSDIQYNGTGCQASWGGSGKLFNAKVKNNGRIQIGIPSFGSIDARSIDAATTLLVDGNPPIYGIYLPFGGGVDITPIPATTSVVTGHTRDIFIGAGSGAVHALNATVGTAISGITPISPDSLNGTYTAPASDRPATGNVEMSGTTLTLPSPCPKVVNVVQPSGSAGSPITIATIDNTNLPSGQKVVLIAQNAGSGETVTVTDSSEICLAGGSRYLSNSRDILELMRTNATSTLQETAFKKNNNNGSSDMKRVRVKTNTGGETFGRDDDILVINKATGVATAVTIDAALNYSGREVLVKDGKGDAAANNITITPASGTIDGAASLVLSTNYAKARLVYNGTQWNVL